MYYAHTFVSWLFFGFVFYMVTRESIFYASLRQAYLISPMNASRISSRTVLFMSVPTSYLTKEKLAEVFGDAVKRIWITSDCKKLDKLVRKRDKLAFRLEELEATYVKSANAARLKSMKSNDQEAALDPTSAHWSRGVKRPTHRLQFLKRKKVDSIDWVRGQLETLIPKVSIMQMKHRIGEAKAIPAVFIEFNTQTDAQIAYQTLSHHAPFQMTPRYIGVPPNQIIWSSLRYSWWEKIVRKFLIQGFIVVLIVFWSIPSAFVGTISNIAYLTDLLPPLRFINDLPTVIKGTISGLLPAAGLALLMSLVPVILRFCARHTGLPSMARVELFTQNAHFAFQVVQVFLVTTITSAASAALDQIIKDPLSAKDILAENLPKSSNFYISYFVLQGLVLSAGAVVQVFGFIIFKILRIFLDTTPRKLYNRWVELSGLSWGTVFPVFTNMAVIAITYSCIAPLILGFSSLGLYLVYQAYRYNLLFVYDNTVDTMGLVYPRALQQVLTGIYLAEICMIGLFAIRAAIGPLILMGIFTLVSILAHISLNEALSPLLSALPRTLDKPDTNSGERDDQKEPSELRRRKPALFDEPPIDEIGKEAAFEKETTVSYATPSRSSSGISSASATAASSGSWPKLRKFFAFFLHPGDYALLRKKVGQYAVVNYPDDIAENAYYPPSVSRPTPLLWIPRDAGGISALEIEATKRVIPITDEEAHLDEKNKVVWDKVRLRPPIWEEKIFY
ncbi:hypothetical protein AJ80_06619 [Polytolypa hystricis UAMH7299]|uniref:CSC1/OSCA1-like 7TM region domain-containing protein n=1 Tax=Polytolypa hystricis (strain UAMH7299) TaxID=1447883 RepID=A0A2B7XTZ2_POLH7|nr:hypothetical protein AJ80_06619 [Polytolypa hystricis UAMH7299]